MEGAIFDCPADWAWLLPRGILRAETDEDLRGAWEALALTRRGCGRLGAVCASCRVLLAPGDCSPALAARLGAGTVITYGMSHTDSLTLSSLTEPVLCVQRALPRADGGVVEPQEFPLPALPGPPEALLPLLGLRLLQMPLTQPPFLW